MPIHPRSGPMLFLAALVPTLVVSGCLGTGPDEDLLDKASLDNGTTVAPDVGPILTITAVEWTGYARVGLAYDPLAHWNPPEDLAPTLWREGFLVEIKGNPVALEFSINWTAATPTTRLLLMAHSPHHGAAGMREYTTEFSGDRQQCLRVPAADLAELEDGLWQPMFHADAGAMVTATITVRALGGNATLPGGPHGHDPADSGETVALIDATVAPYEHEPCEGPLAGH